MRSATVNYQGKRYVFDGENWFGAADFMQPAQSVIGELEKLISATDKLQIKMEARRCGDVGLRHLLGYHSPEVMGVGAEECSGLEFLTSKDFGDPVGDVLWFVGKGRGCRRFFLRSYYIIEAVRASDSPQFEHVFAGSESHAALFDPMPELTELEWFQAFFPGTSCAKGFGMDLIDAKTVGHFKRVAEVAGQPFRY